MKQNIKMQNKLKTFLKELKKEKERFARKDLTREKFCSDIVDLAIKYGLMDKLEKLNPDLRNIIELAMDLEVPNHAYRGDIEKDLKLLLYLIDKLEN